MSNQYRPFGVLVVLRFGVTKQTGGALSKAVAFQSKFLVEKDFFIRMLTAAIFVPATLTHTCKYSNSTSRSRVTHTFTCLVQFSPQRRGFLRPLITQFKVGNVIEILSCQPPVSIAKFVGHAVEHAVQHFKPVNKANS